MPKRRAQKSKIKSAKRLMSDSKRKAGSLEQQFKYYKKRLDRRLIEEEAMQRARGRYITDTAPQSFFKKLDFKQVYDEGIWRKTKSGKLKHYVGDKAVKIQIESMRRRASKVYMKNLYIENYIKALRKVYPHSRKIKEIEKELRKLNYDELTRMINTGKLKSIQFVYSQKE